MCGERKGNVRVVCVYLEKGGNSLEFVYREENGWGVCVCRSIVFNVCTEQTQKE